MSNQAKSSLASHRARLAHRGFVRIEVNVSKADASLVRHVAAAFRTASPGTILTAIVALRRRIGPGNHRPSLATDAARGVDVNVE